MISATIPLFFLLAITSSGTSSSDVSAVVGTWEGESKCTVPDSPCHDEHVVYEVKAQWQKLVIDGYKIVNGEKQFMGTIECGEIKDGKISCTIPRKNKTRIDDWVFEIKGGVMDGTLYMGKERTVYRKIHVTKK